MSYQHLAKKDSLCVLSFNLEALKSHLYFRVCEIFNVIALACGHSGPSGPLFILLFYLNNGGIAYTWHHKILLEALQELRLTC
jgi:hypothetical protein